MKNKVRYLWHNSSSGQQFVSAENTSLALNFRNFSRIWSTFALNKTSYPSATKTIFSVSFLNGSSSCLSRRSLYPKPFQGWPSPKIFSGRLLMSADLSNWISPHVSRVATDSTRNFPAEGTPNIFNSGRLTFKFTSMCLATLQLEHVPLTCYCAHLTVTCLLTKNRLRPGFT